MDSLIFRYLCQPPHVLVAHVAPGPNSPLHVAPIPPSRCRGQWGGGSTETRAPVSSPHSACRLALLRPILGGGVGVVSWAHPDAGVVPSGGLPNWAGCLVCPARPN